MILNQVYIKLSYAMTSALKAPDQTIHCLGKGWPLNVSNSQHSSYASQIIMQHSKIDLQVKYYSNTK